MDEQFWNERYREQDQLWSGEPNGLLVAEVGDLPPGRALDLGCGEGGDAIWLARRGWRVTAVDISQVALDRAAAAGAALNGQVTWTRADITTAPPQAGAFDLVAAIYFPLPHEAGPAAVRGLLDAVAPGGTLLIGGHDMADHGHRHDQHEADHEPAFDPALYYRPDEIAALLGDGWTIVTDERRERVSPAPPGTGHIHDIVLRARRADR
jgi:SAM-dependent methyltransferase